MKKKRYYQAVQVLLNGEQTHRKEMLGVGIAGLFIFSLLALFSYNPLDWTWFYFSSENQSATNWCGSIGAHLAGLLVYLFGSASYLFVCLLLFPVGLLFFRKPVLKEWPHMLMLMGMVSISSVLSEVYNYNLMAGQAGGMLGKRLADGLVPVFGFGGTQLLLWGLLWVMINWMFEVSLTVYVPIIINAVNLAAWAGMQLVLSAFEWSGVCFNWMGVQATWHEPAEAAVRPASSTQQFDDSEDEAGLHIVATSIQEQNELKEIVHEQQAQESDFWDENFTQDPDERDEDIGDNASLDDLRERLHVRPLYKYKQSRHVRIINKPFALAPNTVLSVNIFAPYSDDLFEGASYRQHIDQVYQEYKKYASEKPKRKKFALPSLSLFRMKEEETLDATSAELAQQQAKKLEEKLQHFGINGKVVGINPGPVITMFQYQPEMGTKLSKILALEDDLAMALQAYSIRILAPIPGKNAVGFEIANDKRQEVWFSEIFASKAFQDVKQELPIVLGIDVVGSPVIQDLVTMPHLLVGGATGSGKSVGMNTMLLSLLCRHSDEELKLILVDPKRLEFTPYADIPHLLFPIVTDPTKAINVLKWVVQEMEERYEVMSHVGVRNVREYRKLSCDGHTELRDMPYIVVMIDELADLMMVAGKDIETQIVRIAQMARAAGIHMIVATQRPSVDVVTGLIKVNFPSRVAFRVSSKVDSRTIIDQQGAEKLLGKGDMLTMHASLSQIKRVHGAYVSDQEVERVATHLRSQKKVEYLNINDVLEQEKRGGIDDFEDELYDQVLQLLQTTDEISISMLQRHFRIGFNRSARLVEKLEMDGLIAPAQGGKPRKVLRQSP